MPQMAPLNWLILFMFFSVLFILFNLMNYYSFLYPIKLTLKKKFHTKYSWKW